MAVENSIYEGPVKVGIGTPRQDRALRDAGCENVFSVEDIEAMLAQDQRFLTGMFRDGDTAVMVQPGLLPIPLMRKIASTGISWQVPGHDVVTFGSDEDRAAWRRQKPRGVVVPEGPEAMGRPPKWPVPTPDQIKALVADWRSTKKRALVVDLMRARVGADVPASWCRDQVIKAVGHARRGG